MVLYYRFLVAILVVIAFLDEVSKVRARAAQIITISLRNRLNPTLAVSDKLDAYGPQYSLDPARSTSSL